MQAKYESKSERILVLRRGDHIKVATSFLELWGKAARKLEDPPNDYPACTPESKMMGRQVDVEKMQIEIFRAVDRIVSQLRPLAGDEHEIARLIWVRGMFLDRAAQQLGITVGAAGISKRNVIWWVASALEQTGLINRWT